MPHKVKHLIWRAANEALPTLHNLVRRKVVQTAYCPKCKDVWEDTVNTLWGCNWLFVIWEVDVELKKRFRTKFNVFADLWAVLLELRNRTDVNLVAIIMWLICNTRNSARMGESVTEYHNIPAKAEAFLLDFKSAQGQEQRVS